MKKIVAFVLLAFILVAPTSYVSASTSNETQNTQPALKVALFVKPAEISVIFTDQNLSQSLRGSCANYSSIVKDRIFGKDNDFVVFKDCKVGMGIVTFNFKINEKYLTVTNDTVVTPTIPLVTKQVVKIVTPCEETDGNVKYLYILSSNTSTEFYGGVIPALTWKRTPVHDPSTSVYVFISDSNSVMIVYKGGAGLDGAVKVSKGRYSKEEGGGYVAYAGKITEFSINKDVRTYFVYDPNCYDVYKAKNADEIIVSKKRNDCGKAGAFVSSYYDGVAKVVVSYTPVSKKDIIEIVVLLVVAVALIIYAVKNIRIERD